MFLQLILVLVVLIPLLAIILDSQFGKALAARMENRNLSGPSDVHAERVAFLVGVVERLSREIERLDEQSEFVHKLLTERQQQEAVLPPGDDSA
jgi:hypothetical protein